MAKFQLTENKFGEYDVLQLMDTETGSKVDIALKGATLLNYFIPLQGKFFNIIDGFQTPDELKSGSGARCWIMTPFANRIPDGKYFFNGKVYQLNPVPPRTSVIHGFTHNEFFKLHSSTINDEFIEIDLLNQKIRPDVFPGYPFSLDVHIKYKLENDKLTISVSGINVGDVTLPFFTGWHSYFKLSDNGIENLILKIDAANTIKTDADLIPLKGNDAFLDIASSEDFDFRSLLSDDKRRINSKIIDICYAGIEKDNDGFFRSSVYNPDNGLEIKLFQDHGVVLCFTGDTLDERRRQSVALEPMEFLTNAYNRKEYSEDISIYPGKSKSFIFGIEIASRKD